MNAQMDIESVLRDFRPGDTRLNMAVRIQGKLKTAFPAGRPGETHNAGPSTNGTNVVVQPPAGLKESKEESTVILVADADMLNDRFCFEDENILGYTVHYPRNHNMTFFANVVEQLVGGADLISIRSRVKTDRPFEVVRKRQAEAELEWLPRYKALLEERGMKQDRLRELEAQKEGGGQVVWTPELKAMRDSLRKDLQKIRADERQVRRKLRGEDVERLGVWVKTANILLMPGIVAVLGIGFGLYRRSRMRK